MSELDAVAELSRLLEDLGQMLTRGQVGRPVNKPGAGLVSELDRVLERRLREALPHLWPGSLVVGEEEGGEAGDWTWWLDPLDGTTNRVHGWPRSAISVALYQGDQATLAAVRDPYQEETFWAARAEGAWCDGKRLLVSGCAQLEEALLCTGFAPTPESQWTICQGFHRESRGVRVSGCASLDLAYVAAGRVDGFWEVDLQPWDVAAGLLLVREAGGWTSDLQGKPSVLTSRDYLACAPGLSQAMLRRLSHL